jgi:hypothetical protein
MAQEEALEAPFHLEAHRAAEARAVVSRRHACLFITRPLASALWASAADFGKSSLRTACR